MSLFVGHAVWTWSAFHPPLCGGWYARPPAGGSGLVVRGLSWSVGSTPIWGVEMPAPPWGAGLVGAALVCVACDASTPPTQPPVEPGTHVSSNFGDCITCASLLETTRMRVAPNQQHPWRNYAANHRAAFCHVDVARGARACIGMDGSASCRLSIVVDHGSIVIHLSFIDAWSCCSLA